SLTDFSYFPGEVAAASCETAHEAHRMDRVCICHPCSSSISASVGASKNTGDLATNDPIRLEKFHHPVKDEPRPHGGYEKTDNARGSVDALRPDLLQNYFGIDQGQVGNSHRRYDRQTDRGEGLQFFAGLFHSGYHADDRGNSPRAEHDRHGQGDES